MPRTARKQPKPKTGGGLRESRFIFVFSEADKVRSLKISCFLLVKSKWHLSWVKCACKSVERLAVIRSREKPHGSVCPPFWILTVEWSGVRSCLLWCYRFQIASFSPSTLENSVLKKHGFQIAPLWRAFSNGSVFGDRFRRCSVDDSRIRSKTAPFSFENGLVWTGP